MNRTLRIALAQINPTVGDLCGNGDKIVSWIRNAEERRADIVAFPELAVCGYPPEDLLLKPRFMRDCRQALGRIAEATTKTVAVVGFPESSGGAAHNSAAVVQNGRMCAVHRKIELPNYGVFDEKRYFEPGAEPLFFTLNGVPVMVTICEDIWVRDGHVEQHVLHNRPSLILNLSASPFHAGKALLRHEVIASLSSQTGSHVAYVNQVGGQDELVFDGGSEIVGPDNTVESSAPRFEEYLLVADVGLRARRAQPGSSRRLALDTGPDPGRPPVLPVVAREPQRLEEIYRALALGTKDYARKNGFQKCVVGLSGGIDSSLAAVIAVEAVGKENVVGVTMPSQYTSLETRADAEMLARNLGIRLIAVPIKPIFESYAKACSEIFGGGKPGVEFENLQARVRGNILMALSNRFGWLVLTTGNKSETAVGYCTLYGDTAGGFAVIKDVPKTLVYDLADYVNGKAGLEPIPRSVVERAPTAELRPNQKDEDSLPTYARLDPILAAYVERDMPPAEIVGLGFGAAEVHRVVGMVDRSEYKRRQAPPGVKITPKAFGRDRRFPITNAYRPGQPGGDANPPGDED